MFHLTSTSRYRLLSAVALAGALLCQPASAAIMLLTRTFTIYDVGNASDPTMADRLRNTQLVFQVKLDTDKGSFFNPTPEYVSFGSDFDLDAVLEVSYGFDSKQFTFTGGSGSVLVENTLATSQEQQNLFITRDYGGGLGFGGEFFATLAPNTLGLDLTKPFFAPGRGGGRFSFFHTVNGQRQSGNLILQGGPQLGAGPGPLDASIRVERLDRTVAPVPEPTTWMLMISGFGVAGAALRRRRERVMASSSR